MSDPEAMDPASHAWIPEELWDPQCVLLHAAQFVVTYYAAKDNTCFEPYKNPHAGGEARPLNDVPTVIQ